MGHVKKNKIKKNWEYLKTRATKDTNGGSGPRNVIVKKMEPFPGLVVVEEPLYVQDFASIP